MKHVESFGDDEKSSHNASATDRRVSISIKNNDIGAIDYDDADDVDDNDDIFD
ncbi:unnamed protein product, partial [Rotaria sordida]